MLDEDPAGAEAADEVELELVADDELLPAAAGVLLLEQLAIKGKIAPKPTTDDVNIFLRLRFCIAFLHKGRALMGQR